MSAKNPLEVVLEVTDRRIDEMRRSMDLGVGDVHVDSTPKRPAMADDKKNECKACMALPHGEKCPDCKKLMKSGTASEDVGEGETSSDSGGGEETEMSRTCRADSVELAAKDADGKEIWIQIAKQGHFKGHAAGEFSMTSMTFAEIIRNFNAQKNRAIPIDFEHASEQDPTNGSIPTIGAPAQGWVTELTVREDGNLWGKVTWGKLARQYIKEGQYRYLSPAVVFRSKDRVTGKPIGARLSSVALTNNPFLDGMAPVAATRKEPANSTVVETIGRTLGLNAQLSKSPSVVHALLRTAALDDKVFRDDLANQLRTHLHLPLTTSDDEVFITARIALGEVISPPAAPAAINPHPPATATHQEAHMGENEKSKENETQVSALTLRLNAAEAEKVTMKAEFEAKLSTVTAERDALTAKIAEFESKEIEGLVTAAISVWGDKKGLSDASKPHLMRLAKNDREAFNALYPPVPAGQRHLSQTLATGSHTIPAQQVGTGDGSGNVIKLRQVIDEENIPSIDDLVTKLMSENKAMTREEAFSKAFTMRTNLINTAATKRLAGNGG